MILITLTEIKFKTCGIGKGSEEMDEKENSWAIKPDREEVSPNKWKLKEPRKTDRNSATGRFRHKIDVLARLEQ